jgi:DNA-binding transcriptional MocR family regulator
MPEPTWTNVEAPILAAIADRTPKPGKMGPSLDDVALATGLDPETVTVALDRLKDAGYVTGLIHLRAKGPAIVNLQLTERGLRAAGVWPSDDPFEDLVRVLNDQINREPDQERASRLRRLLSAVVDAGRDVGVGVLTELATRGALGR